jgi:dolichol-phosphate mannosyltransferase
MKITIIIPCYNEAPTIQRTILSLEEQVGLMIDKHSVSLLIFDSSSTDGTADIVKSMQQQFNNIELISEPVKSGLGSAYVQAMEYAWTHLRADVIFEYDADGSHQPQFIVPMLAAIEAGADVALGSRYVLGGVVDVAWPWYRRLISQAGNWFARCMLTSRYKDFTSGFRATRSVFLRQVLAEPLLSKNYAYKIHLLWRLHQLGAKIVEVPIVFIDRETGYSKFPRNNIWESLYVVLQLRWRAFKA